MELEFYFPKTKSKHKCVPTTGKVYPSKGGTIRYGVQATMNGSKSLPKYITEQEFNRLGFGAESFEASVDLGEKRISSRKDYDIDNDYEYEDLEIGDVDLLNYEDDLNSNLEDDIRDAIRESVDDNLPLDDGDTGGGYVDVDTEIDISVPVSGQVKFDWTSNENYYDENTDNEWNAETFGAERKMSKSTTFKGKWETDTTRKIDGVNVTKVLWNKYVVEYKGYLGHLEDADVGEGYWRIRFYDGDEDSLPSWAGDFDGDWDWLWKKYGKNESSRYYYTSRTTFSKEIALDDFKEIVDKIENGDELTRNVFASNDEYLREKERVAGLDKEERYELYDENKLECDECGAVNKTVGYVEEGHKLCEPCDREWMAKQGYEAEMASLSEIVFEDNVGKKYTTHSDYDHSLINDMVSDEDLVPMDAETVGSDLDYIRYLTNFIMSRNPTVMGEYGPFGRYKLYEHPVRGDSDFLYFYTPVMGGLVVNSALHHKDQMNDEDATIVSKNLVKLLKQDNLFNKNGELNLDGLYKGTEKVYFAETVGSPSPSSPLEEVPATVPSPAEPTNENFEAESKNTKMVLGITALGIGLAFWKGKDLLSLWDRIKEKMD